MLAEVLAEAGASIRVVAPTLQVVEQALVGARKWDQEAVGTVIDMGEEQVVEQALERLGGGGSRVDILVNSFRVEYARPVVDVTTQEWDRVFNRNVRSVFLLCKAVGGAMTERGGGRIINIISNLAERGMVNSTAFCASQGAVLQLTKALALEWGRHNVRVNAIGTGQFTERDESPEEAQKELLVRYIPLRRRGHPRDIASLLVYLASDTCDYTTGQPIYVDGGLMAHP